jgi:acetoin utilization deacetylase AcuC-like enzyme
VYSDKHKSHDPQFFLVRGQVRKTTEQPERAVRLLKGLADGKHTIVAPTEFGQGPRARVHSPEYLRFLESAWEEWIKLPDYGDEQTLIHI